MQIQNWDDLRYLLAIKRGGSIAGAAKLLGVNDTTISRRISHLQQNMGGPLIHRLPNGSMELTVSGESMAEKAERAEYHIESIEDAVAAEAQQCAGVVRLTSVPIVVNQLLTPNINSLLEKHPKLEVELVSDSRDLSLSRREADIAIRLSRPTAGGTQLKIRKLGELPCSVYALQRFSQQQLTRLPWIAYDDSLAHIPPDKWVRRVTAKNLELIANIRVHDAETALQAVLAGVGKTVLPDAIAMRDDRLKTIPITGCSKPPARELWMLSHANQSHLPRILAVVDWLEEVLTD